MTKKITYLGIGLTERRAVYLDDAIEAEDGK